MAHELATVRRVPGHAVVTMAVEGQVDASNAVRVERELRELADLAASPSVVLDLGGLEYLDSAGLHMLTRLSRDTALLVAAPEVGFAHDVIVLGGLDGELRLHASVEAARASALAGPAGGPPAQRVR